MGVGNRSIRRALLAAASLLPTLLPWAASAQTILWDKYAVPHIYGPDNATVIRGLGYAQMENHAETLLNNIALQRGRLAEYFGPGPNNANIASDIQVRTYGIPSRAAQWIAGSSTTQLQYIQAFCDGVNEYAARAGSTIPATLRKILPMTPADLAMIAQYTIWFTFLPETDNAPTLISEWTAGQISAGTAVQSASINPRHGSNGWAIGPSKTADGNAILVGNPHLPWGAAAPVGGLGIYQWFEANLVVGNPNAPTLNAQGVTFLGSNFIGIGFNDYLGWTHTNNTIKNADLYQLTLDSTATHYLYNGVMLPLVHTTDTIKVLQPDGVTLVPQTVNIYASIHGPIVATRSFGGQKQALALRVPLPRTFDLSGQYWRMIQAQNVSQFMAAESELQMPFFNTMYADRDKHIFYLFGGGQPNRMNSALPFSAIEGILDGSNPALLWTQTLSFNQLPQALDPGAGFIANSNNPPWNSAFDDTVHWTPPATLNPANFPAYISPQFMDFRPQQGTAFLDAASGLTMPQVLTAKMSTRMELADRIVGDLIRFANGSSDATAKLAAAILSAWDHTAESTSVGGLLFENWYNRIVADIEASPPTIVADTSDSLYYPHPKFINPWTPSAPITTPNTLDPVNEAQMLKELDNAYNDLQSNHASLGGAKAPWGALHKTTLVTRSGLDDFNNIFPFLVNDPNSGTDDIFGPIRVVDSAYVPVLNQFISYGGDGYVQEIEFTPTGSVGGTLLTYGNASRPNSPAITAQLPFYESKTLKPALRTYSAVKQNAVRSENY